MTVLRMVVLITILISSTVCAKPIVTELKMPYKIDGLTAEKLRLHMNQIGPTDISGQHFDASTRWFVKWSYYYRMTETLCYLSHIRVSVDITYKYPEWSGQSASDVMLQNRWADYINKLHFHEQGHAETGKSAAVDIEKALLNLRPMKNCKMLETTADNKAYEIIAQHNTRDINYDDQTNHGMNQGAVFP